MSVLHPSTLRERGNHIRSISSDRIGRITVDDDLPPAEFSCAVIIEKSGNVPVTDGSPRAKPKLQLWWRPQGANPPDLHAGHRVEVDGVVYEMTSNPRAMRAGPKVYGYWAEMLPKDVIYPLDGALRTLGEDEESPILPVAVWYSSGTDRVTGRSFYQDPSGEAPVEYYEALRAENVKLRVGDQLYSVTSPSINTQGFFVTFSLTTGEGSGWHV